jgi:hypothetical protein
MSQDRSPEHLTPPSAIVKENWEHETQNRAGHPPRDTGAGEAVNFDRSPEEDRRLFGLWRGDHGWAYRATLLGLPASQG